MSECKHKTHSLLLKSLKQDPFLHLNSCSSPKTWGLFRNVKSFFGLWRTLLCWVMPSLPKQGPVWDRDKHGPNSSEAPCWELSPECKELMTCANLAKVNPPPLDYTSRGCMWLHGRWFCIGSYPCANLTS